MAKQGETLLKEKLIARLKKLPNCWHVKIQQVAKRGTPDILICLGGIFVAIELKSEDGNLDPLQRYNIERIASCGGIAMVVTPQNLEASMNFLENVAKEHAKYGSKNPVYQ